MDLTVETGGIGMLRAVVRVERSVIMEDGALVTVRVERSPATLDGALVTVRVVLSTRPS